MLKGIEIIKRKYKKISPCFLVSILLIIIAVGCEKKTGPKTTVEEVETMIKREIPIGSSKEQVLSFIDSLKIDSLKIVRGKCYEDLSGLKYEKFEDPNLMKSIKEYFNAAILDVEKYSEFGTNHIKMTFYFDAEEHLIYYKVYNQGAKP